MPDGVDAGSLVGSAGATLDPPRDPACAPRPPRGARGPDRAGRGRARARRPSARPCRDVDGARRHRAVTRRARAPLRARSGPRALGRTSRNRDRRRRGAASRRRARDRVAGRRRDGRRCRAPPGRPWSRAPRDLLCARRRRSARASWLRCSRRPSAGASCSGSRGSRSPGSFTRCPSRGAARPSSGRPSSPAPPVGEQSRTPTISRYPWDREACSIASARTAPTPTSPYAAARAPRTPMRASFVGLDRAKTATGPGRASPRRRCPRASPDGSRRRIRRASEIVDTAYT